MGKKIVLAIFGGIALVGVLLMITGFALGGRVTNLSAENGRVVLDTGSEKILFPSDAAYTPLNFGPPVRLPGLCADPLEYRASMERIRALAKEENCKIFWSHWPVEGM